MIKWLKFKNKRTVLRYEWDETQMRKVFYKTIERSNDLGFTYGWQCKVAGYKSLMVNYKNDGVGVINVVEFGFDSEEDAAMWKLTNL